ncbi:unnamed protein product [Periconia digitata]|uniref:Uncharacterized protein n=1 Tax=Periconia digitata TaxID=1303443 RepID=A0A9W4UCV2_9PLEO|nr:unnamed protein product [Periconia digitata]
MSRPGPSSFIWRPITAAANTTYTKSPTNTTDLDEHSRAPTHTIESLGAYQVKPPKPTSRFSVDNHHPWGYPRVADGPCRAKPSPISSKPNMPPIYDVVCSRQLMIGRKVLV